MSTATYDGEVIVDQGYEDSSLAVIPAGAIELATRSEIFAISEIARRNPRSVSRFMKQATDMCTISQEVAQSCTYAVPRGKTKSGEQNFITGPSINFAQIIMSCWRNIRVSAQVIEVQEKVIVAQAVCIDAETNNAVQATERRSIWGKYGRFNDDMIEVTGRAACAIATRNAILRVIPKALHAEIYRQAMECMKGNEKSLSETLNTWMDFFQKKGFEAKQVYRLLGVEGFGDMNSEHLEIIVGLHNRVKEKETTWVHIFAETTEEQPKANGTKAENIASKIKGSEKPQESQ